MRTISFFLCLLLFSSLSAFALESSPSQVPPRDKYGNANLTYHWIEGGGARLYWNSVPVPTQVRLRGVPFRDPASYPLLNADQDKAKKRYVSKKWKKKKVAKKSKKKVKVASAKTAIPPLKKEAPKTQEAKTPKPAAKKNKETLPPPIPGNIVDPVGSFPPERLQ